MARSNNKILCGSVNACNNPILLLEKMFWFEKFYAIPNSFAPAYLEKNSSSIFSLKFLCGVSKFVLKTSKKSLETLQHYAKNMDSVFLSMRTLLGENRDYFKHFFRPGNWKNTESLIGFLKLALRISFSMLANKPRFGL